MHEKQLQVDVAGHRVARGGTAVDHIEHHVRQSPGDDCPDVHLCHSGHKAERCGLLRVCTGPRQFGRNWFFTRDLPTFRSWYELNDVLMHLVSTELSHRIVKVYAQTPQFPLHS